MSKKLSVDIGSNNIKIIEFGSNDELIKTAINLNPTGKNLSQMTNSEKMSLADNIKSYIAQMGTKASKVHLSIPDSLVYAKVAKFPKMSTPELATAIKWELDQTVPFPPSEVESSWSVLDGISKIKQTDDIYVYLVATPSKISEAYVGMFEYLEMEIEVLENESVSLHKAFSPMVPDNGVSVLLDFGNSGTNIVLISKEAILNNYYFSVGGSAITKVIAESFGMPSEQAESYKRTYGLLPEQLDGKLLSALNPVMSNLVLEVKKMLISYKTDFGNIDQSRIIMTGGGSYMPGLARYLATAFDGVSVTSGNVFESESLDPAIKPLGQVFGVSFGLGK